MAYLTIVYKIADSYEEKIVREAVERTVQYLQHIDFAKYKVGQFVSFKTDICIFYLRVHAETMACVS